MTFKTIYWFSQYINTLKRLAILSIFQQSKGLSNERIEPLTTSGNSLAPSLNFVNARTRGKFIGICVKQDKATFGHKNIVNIYIVYKINLWPYRRGGLLQDVLHLRP